MIRKIKIALTNRIRYFAERAIKVVNPYFSLPSSLSFTLSNKCNWHCSFCPKTIYGVEEEKTKPEVLDSIVKLAKNIGRVQILGLGEPLVNQNFWGIVKRLKSSDVYISLTTNGLLLNENISEQLCQLGVDEIIFSIEGAKKETHQIVKDSKFDELITNVKKIYIIKQKLRTKRPKLSFIFVGMTNNITELPGIIELANKLGVEQVYLANVMSFDENTCNYHLHRNPQLASYYMGKGRETSRKLSVALKIYVSLSPHPTYCHWYNRPHIGLDGDVYPCNFIGAQDSLKSSQAIWYEGVFVKTDISEYRLGNILDEKLERIWNNQKIRSLRKVFSESMKEDKKLDWDPETYKNLLLRYQDRELTPEEFCRICPHRFRITH